MRVVLRILLGLVAAFVLLVGAGIFLPREVTVERSVEIDAPAEDIFPHINNLRASVPWSPWLSQDPNTELSFGEVEEGEGATMIWASENPHVGSGRLEVVGSVPNEHVAIALALEGMGSSTATWDLVEADGKTTATWGFAKDMGLNPASRWLGLMMDEWVGGDYERGLQNLKELVEG